MKNIAFILLLSAFGLGCDNPIRTEDPDLLPEAEFSLVLSTMQLVTETVDPQKCPSGWTKLAEELGSSSAVVPLQSRYVKRFATIQEMFEAVIEVKSLVAADFSYVRVSVPWPCWQHSQEFRKKFIAGLNDLIKAGWRTEITLTHHDSYPAFLHQTGNIDSSGWAANLAPESFEGYVGSVLSHLEEVLPKSSRIYITNEPFGSVGNGYFNPQGSWPPGGRYPDDLPESIQGAKAALLNMRQAFRKAGEMISSAGWRPAMAKNIRPGAEGTTLDYVFNWWLADALILGVDDDDFNGRPERQGASVLGSLGITFYGTMSAGPLIQLSENLTMPLPIISFWPDREGFRQSLQSVLIRYGQITEIGVAEIGFSDASTFRMTDWFRDYMAEAARLDQEHNVSFVGLYTLFEAAEFSAGDWRFHLAEGCGSLGPCRLTEWGESVVSLN